MAFELQHVSTGYEHKIISKDVDIRIPLEKVTALIGSNGCGKSTLLKTICRIIAPKGGSVILNGEDIHKKDTKELAKQLAILPQNPMAPGSLTVRDLISYGRAPHKSGILQRESQRDRELIDWAIDVTDLHNFAHTPIQNLSGGQRQRAWIAMAIAQDTDILFLDEPTSYLDISHQMDVLELVERLNQEYKKTVIMVIHELNQAARYADHIIAMKDGDVHFQGTPHEVLTEEMLSKIFGVDSIILNDPRTNRPYCIAYTHASVEKAKQVGGAL